MSERIEAVYLSQEEKARTRTLYEAVFSEDTERFVDFYYRYKVKYNKILAIEKENRPVAMLHLNPYVMIVNGYQVNCSYIVAVATDKDYRKRGYMRVLMEQALQDMACQRMPFTFLMPADERLYTPFDFSWICPYTFLPGKFQRMEADEQNRYLAARYQMFCYRDERYMTEQRAQREAEQGEPLAEKMPPYMARITNVARMLQMAYSLQKRTWYLYVKDSLIKENDGYYLWRTAPDASEAVKLDRKPEKLDLELTVGELASMIFGGFQICLSEVV